MEDKRTVSQTASPPTVAFTGLAQLCGQKSNEREMGAVIFVKNSEGKSLTFDCCEH